MAMKVSKVKSLQIRAAVLFFTILSARSERWYSATVVERETPKVIFYGSPKVNYKRHPENIRDKNYLSLPVVNLKTRNQTRDAWKLKRKHDFNSMPPTLAASMYPNIMPKNVSYEYEYIVKKNTPMIPIVEPLITSEWTPQDWTTMSYMDTTKINSDNEIKKSGNFGHESKPVVNKEKDSLVTFGLRPPGSNGKYDSLTQIKYHHDFNSEPQTRTTFKFNNTIHNINVIKTKPKRKVIPRGCPGYSGVKRRQKKQLIVDSSFRKRFLEVFEVVEFDHVACTSSSGLEGICLPEQECSSPGGKTMGSCADGYGACCVSEFSCEDRTAAPSGWFTNPGFPSPSNDRLSCMLTLEKASPDIRQIRLDFTNFELLPPTDGTCEQDQLVVSGHSVNNIVPILCGVNTGQHMYIEVGDVEGPVIISVQTVSADSRLFSIKFTQINAFDDLAAPAGCLQYYTGPRGVLESFNYGDKSAISIARVPSYLNNMNYAMCIEREPSACSVTYTNTDYMQIVNYDADGLPVIPPGQAGVEIFNCPTDWLLMAAVRLCGDRLNDGSVLQDFALDAPATDVSAGPIMVWFRSDGGYVGRGFRLQYQQNHC